MRILRTLSVWGALALLACAEAAAQVPPAAPPPTPPPADPNARVATGQAPVVGGNAAGARERALDDAIRQVVDQALAELTDPQTRAAQAKAIRALEARARSFVGSYRTLEEGELNGVYSVRIQAEVDLVALRRKVERWTNPASAPPPPTSAPSLVVKAGEGTTGDFIARLSAALAAAGVRAGGESAGSLAVGGPVATVAVTTHDEGALRGTGRVAVACQATARFTGAPLPERTASARAFAETAESGRAVCLGRLAGALAADLASALGPTAASAGGDLPILTIDADVVEPAAVAALLKSVRAVGAVSGADLVRVGGGHAEIRARTRSAPGPLAAALSRDADAMISLSDVQTAGGVIRLRARLRAPAAEAGSATP